MRHSMREKFIILLLLLGRLSSCSGSSRSDDVQCLKDLKESLDDPSGALSTWNFPSNYYEGYVCQFNGVDCWTHGENKVMAVHLGNMGLQGSFPRGLQFCTSLTALLDLSNNNLSGPLPADMNQQLPYITKLDLSNNSFSGEIPPGIGNLTYLNALNLQHNRLTGRIPEHTEEKGEISRLISFSVADNSLSGPIPGYLQKFAAKDFAGNDGLCGPPLDRECKSKSKRRFHVRIHIRLRRVNDASSIGAAAGFIVGFVVAFYFPYWFLFCGGLRPYIVPVCG